MRIKRGVGTKKTHKKLKKATKGFIHIRRASVKKAREAFIKAGTRAYSGRKKRKRDLRRLWIIRLNAAVRKNGLSYSKFIHLLKKNKIELDRKILAEIAFERPEIFKKIVAELK